MGRKCINLVLLQQVAIRPIIKIDNFWEDPFEDQEKSLFFFNLKIIDINSKTTIMHEFFSKYLG